MTELYPNEIPMSFTCNAMYYAATSFLNPPRKKDKDSTIADALGDGMLVIALSIYRCAINILVPFGLLYHSVIALTYPFLSLTSKDIKKREKYKELAFEHLKCAYSDMLFPLDQVSQFLPRGFFPPGNAFFEAPEDTVARFSSGRFVKTAPLTDAEIVLFANQLKKSPDSFHNFNIEDMKKGLYRFDELAYASLKLKKEDQSGGPIPSYSANSVRKIAFERSWNGHYEWHTP